MKITTRYIERVKIGGDVFEAYRISASTLATCYRINGIRVTQDHYNETIAVAREYCEPERIDR